MSDDMSVFKKVKDKISDEVNSATNKLQNIQIIDQLTSTIGQHAIKNDSIPHQNLPELPEQMTMRVSSHPELVDHYEDDEEINSSISPQHHLFDGGSIRRLGASNDKKTHKPKKNGSVLHPEGMTKDQLSSTNVSTATSSEIEARSNPGSPHQPSKHAAKIRDLEKIMAKCKESLKTKNTQLTMLKNSLNEVERFKESLDDVRCELRELKSAHETWTLSIAESKRVMHQEIEEKNAVIGKLKCQLKDGTEHSHRQKSTIQNLESRLVSISLAHQKERDGLIKELMNAKNSAIRQLQKEHELQLERVKLDLEKSIESLKSDILSRDQQIIRNEQKQQILVKQNQTLVTELEAHRKKCDEDQDKFKVIESERQQYLNRIDELVKAMEQAEAENPRGADLTEENSILEERIRELENKINDLNDGRSELKNNEIDNSSQASNIPCSKCLEIQQRLDKQAENHEQFIFELTAQLNLMTTANADQEKAISDLKAERDNNLESAKTLKLDCDELVRKNESLTQDMREYESDLRIQQGQAEQLKNQVETLKNENSSLKSRLEELKQELIERDGDLVRSQEIVDSIKIRLVEAEKALECCTKDTENLSKDRESLKIELESMINRKRESDQHLVINILAALKNLETPETSPGSDKMYDRYEPHDGQDRDLPDLLGLAENLSSLALDRSNAYLTSNQRLQAVLLDNTMISDELKRLRDELNDLNRQKTQDVINSLEEVERLRGENQALIHDQKAYDDHIASLESDIESLKRKLSEFESSNSQSVNPANLGAEESKITKVVENDDSEIELENMRNTSIQQATDTPSSTEFEYLKNIVYQFLMGREPVTLARVISAIFKFDMRQVEQICKIQEAIHQVSS